MGLGVNLEFPDARFFPPCFHPGSSLPRKAVFQRVTVRNPTFWDRLVMRSLNNSPLMSVWITSLCPISQARKSGVCFMTSVASTWALFSSNSFTVPTWPESAAACKAKEGAEESEELLSGGLLPFYCPNCVPLPLLILPSFWPNAIESSRWSMLHLHAFSVSSFLSVCIITLPFPRLLPSPSHCFPPFHPVGLKWSPRLLASYLFLFLREQEDKTRQREMT